MGVSAMLIIAARAAHFVRLRSLLLPRVVLYNAAANTVRWGSERSERARHRIVCDTNTYC